MAPGVPVSVPCQEGGDQELSSQKVDLVHLEHCLPWSVVTEHRRDVEYQERLAETLGRHLLIPA
eukprot:4610257-Prorocentrum_lima.AAC.1